jgi:hypothetical protein
MRLPASFFALAIPFWALIAGAIGFLLIAIVVTVAEGLIGFDLGTFWTWNFVLQAVIAIAVGAPFTLPIARQNMRTQRELMAAERAATEPPMPVSHGRAHAHAPVHQAPAHHAAHPAPPAHGAHQAHATAHPAKKEH